MFNGISIKHVKDVYIWGAHSNLFNIIFNKKPHGSLTTGTVANQLVRFTSTGFRHAETLNPNCFTAKLSSASAIFRFLFLCTKKRFARSTQEDRDENETERIGGNVVRDMLNRRAGISVVDDIKFMCCASKFPDSLNSSMCVLGFSRSTRNLEKETLTELAETWCEMWRIDGSEFPLSTASNSRAVHQNFPIQWILQGVFYVLRFRV